VRVVDSVVSIALSLFHPLGRPVGSFGMTRKVIKWVEAFRSQEIDGG
jgi:hypothetical protein